MGCVPRGGTGVQRLATRGIVRSTTWFGHAVGHAETLGAVAERMELHHMKGTPACRERFT